MRRRDENELDRARVVELLDELGRRLSERGVTGRIRIVGGAAMALRYGDDDAVRVTTDIDAVYAPRPDVDLVIAEMAAERKLPGSWLNASATPWVPGRTHPLPVTDSEAGFVVEVAEPDELIAMKLAAAREQDLADLRVLIRHCGIPDAETLVDIAYRVYGEDSIALPDGRESYLLLAADLFP